MSTKGTIQFAANLPVTPEITLAIHLDAYPSCVAKHLRAMLQEVARVDANIFFRGHRYSAIVTDHAACAVPSYRYWVSQTGRLLVKEWKSRGRDEWTPIYEGDLLTFVNEQPGDYLHLLQMPFHASERYYTLAQLRETLSAYQAEAAQLEVGSLPYPSRTTLALAREKVAQLEALVKQAGQRERAAGRRVIG